MRKKRKNEKKKKLSISVTNQRPWPLIQFNFQESRLYPEDPRGSSDYPRVFSPVFPPSFTAVIIWITVGF